MTRVKKGLSYVLGDSVATENHILPINSMQYLASTGQLYTGGRDGAVKVWAPSESRKPVSYNYDDGDTDDNAVDQDIDERLLKLETSISSNPLRPTRPCLWYQDSAIKNYNLHFDWINDIKLVNDNRHLVTALADLSLKMIDLASSSTDDVQKFHNVHTDYIKKISSIASQNLLVSGGLDGNIVIWDLRLLKPILLFHNSLGSPLLPSSVYSLSNNRSNLVASGGPSSTINIFDRRITTDGGANLVRRLVGHQDNVRCLVMNLSHILSGSSDSTVKLWDLRNFKVSRNFEMHDDAVWSLTTPSCSDPSSWSDLPSDFNVFYSGDKAGNIIKTDMSYFSHTVPDDDAAHFNFSAGDSAFIDEKIGLCTLVAKDDSPIVSLCVGENSSLFASTYESLNTYHVPDTRQMAKYQYLRTGVDHANAIDCQTDDDTQGGLDGSHTDQTDLDSDFYDIVSHLSMDTGNLDMQSSFSHAISSVHGMEPSENANDPSTMYTSMFLSASGGPSLEFVNAYKEEWDKAVNLHDSGNSNNSGNVVNKTPVEILLNPVSPGNVLSIAFNTRPLQSFSISPKSIISKKMLNNKRWIVVLYLNGDIKIWDIFICKVVKEFPFRSQKGLLPETKKERTLALDDIFQQYQTMDTFSNWCEVEIKSGKLLVSLLETSFANVEMYYDELVQDYPFMALEQNDVARANHAHVSTDERYPLSQMLINSLFHSYAVYELKNDEFVREELRVAFKAKSSGSGSENESTQSFTSAGEDIGKKRRLFSRKTSKASVVTQQLTPLKQNQPHSPLASVASNLSDLGDDSFSLADSLSVSDHGGVSDDSILKMLSQNVQKYNQVYATQGTKKLAPSQLSIYSNDILVQDKTEDASYKPFIPLEQLPENLLIIIFENSSDLGNNRDVCSFHLGELRGLEQLAKNRVQTPLVKQLRVNLPKWIGNPVLYDKFPQRDLPKIAFQLMEYDYATLPPEKKIQGKTQRKIKKLPPLDSSVKLASQNMLRLNKVLFYLTEKFEYKTSEMKEKRAPTEWLQVECKGHVLDPNMTLQTIKTKIWKSSSDIELRYRRKFD